MNRHYMCFVITIDVNMSRHYMWFVITIDVNMNRHYMCSHNVSLLLQ